MFLIPGERSYFSIPAGVHPGYFQKHDPGAGNNKGYRDITIYNGKFLAVGTDGRIDYINNSGERIPVI